MIHNNLRGKGCIYELQKYVMILYITICFRTIHIGPRAIIPKYGPHARLVSGIGILKIRQLVFVFKITFFAYNCPFDIVYLDTSEQILFVIA